MGSDGGGLTLCFDLAESFPLSRSVEWSFSSWCFIWATFFSFFQIKKDTLIYKLYYCIYIIKCTFCGRTYLCETMWHFVLTQKIMLRTQGLGAGHVTCDTTDGILANLAVSIGTDSRSVLMDTSTPPTWTHNKSSADESWCRIIPGSVSASATGWSEGSTSK